MRVSAIIFIEKVGEIYKQVIVEEEKITVELRDDEK